MIDYALEQAGGKVIHSRCSDSMREANSFIRFFGFSFSSYKNTPDRAINANTRPGSCWAFSGSRGHLVIKVSRPIIVTDLTVEHIPKNLSPSGSIQAKLENIFDHFSSFAQDFRVFPQFYFGAPGV